MHDAAYAFTGYIYPNEAKLLCSVLMVLYP